MNHTCPTATAAIARRFLIGVLVLAASLAGCAPELRAGLSADSRSAASKHRIGPGDAVTVQVYGRPEMSTTTTVGDDGSITVPLSGPVKIAGLSAQQASDRVEKMLRDGDYLVKPSVTLTLTQQFYIYGEVHQPNMYKLEPGMTVIQAIVRGGGVTPRGSDSRIEITRRQGNGPPQKFSADGTDLVLANDVIRVKERIF